MNQEEIKDHFKRADEVVNKAISESKENFDKITGLIEQRYSEINKGELIVVTGAFSLIITFLIQHNKDIFYQNVLYLKLSICFLFFVIIWKFHINRRSTKIAEKERDLINENLNLLLKIQYANTEFLINNNTKELLKTPKIFEKIEFLEKEKKSLNDTYNKTIGLIMNELEYIAFFCGTAFLLIFFLSNI